MTSQVISKHYWAPAPQHPGSEGSQVSDSKFGFFTDFSVLGVLNSDKSEAFINDSLYFHWAFNYPC